MPLFKYEGPVLDYNFKVRKREYTATIKAKNLKQAQLFLTLDYKRKYNLSEICYIRLKEKYIKEVASE